MEYTGKIYNISRLLHRKFHLNSDVRAYYLNYSLPNGNSISTERAMQYTINYSMLIALNDIMTDLDSIEQATGNTGLTWDDVLHALDFCRESIKHTLPHSQSHIQRLMRSIVVFKGYESLISKRLGNSNAKKSYTIFSNEQGANRQTSTDNNLAINQ